MSCSKEIPVFEGGEMIIRADVQQTRTAMDGLKVIWQKNDRIVVNGQKSTGITIGSDPSKAQFTLPYAGAPLYALYPGDAYVSGSTYGSVELAAEQAYVKDSFDPAAALMCAYSPEPGSSLSFKHGVSYLKFIISGVSDKDSIKRVEVYPLGAEDMCGTMEFDPSAMKLVNNGTEGKGVKITGAIGQGDPVVVAIAAKTYASGIKLRIVDVKDHFMDVKSSKSFEAKQGTVFRTDISFVPTGTLIDAQADSFNRHSTLKVLFIGNSHDLDATAYLPQMLNRQGIRDFEFTRVFHGGYWLQAYNTNYSVGNNCSITKWRPGQQNWRGTTDLTYSLRDAVEAQSYDIVVIQEYAGKSYCWTWTQAERDAINGLVQKIRKMSPDADLYYFLSHCFAPGYSVLVENFNNDPARQFAACVEGNGKHILDPDEHFPFKGLISTGALVQNLRTTGLNVFDGMLRGDMIHLDYGLTRIAASLLMWKHLITPRTGVKPEDVAYRLVEYYPSASMHTTPFIEENRPAVLAAVNAAYDKPLETTDLSSYSSVPSYVNVPGKNFLDTGGVDVEPCSFPVNFRLGYKDGVQINNGNTQCRWAQFGTFESNEQPQAFAKWVSVSSPVQGLIYKRTFANVAERNISTIALDEVWTGDYFEFVIPVKNFKGGTTVRFEAPLYTRQGPVFWYLDYLDGDQWKCNHSLKQSWDGLFTCDATFAIGYEQTAVSADVTFASGVEEGFLRFRLRCADGSIQATPDGAVERTAPQHSADAYAQAFYFWGPSNNISFTITE